MVDVGVWLPDHLVNGGPVRLRYDHSDRFEYEQNPIIDQIDLSTHIFEPLSYNGVDHIGFESLLQKLNQPGYLLTLVGVSANNRVELSRPALLGDPQPARFLYPLPFRRFAGHFGPDFLAKCVEESVIDRPVIIHGYPIGLEVTNRSAALRTACPKTIQPNTCSLNGIGN